MRIGRRFGAAAIGLLAVICLSVVTSRGATPLTSEELMRARKVVARWHVTGAGQLQEAYRRGLDVWEEHPDPRTGYFTVMITDGELAQLRQSGYQIEVVDPDYYKTRQAMEPKVPNGGFRTWTQCIALMDSIHAAHPTITTAKFSIGRTYEFRPMWAMKISDNPDVDENEPEILFTGIHHAREPLGMEVCLETMRRLTDGYGTDTLITRLVNEREIFFIPVVNPDGYEYNLLTNPDGGGMWRKNREENLDGSFGVDLNRNYSYMWGYDDVGSSPVPGSSDYRGRYPFSEPETQNMRGFVNSRHFVIIVHYHSNGNAYMWPWGYDYVYAPDHPLFAAIGDSMRLLNGYLAMPSFAFGINNGDANDWGYGAQTEHAKVYSFTGEVGKTSEGGSWPSPDRIPGIVAKCQGPNLVFIDLADTPERLLPPETPTWVSPADTVSSRDYTLEWSDPGGVNGAASFKLEELFGPHAETDNAEKGMSDWLAQGFTLSTARAASGTHSYFCGPANSARNSLTTSEFYHVLPGDTLRAKVWYDLESYWDWAYAEVSTDRGAHFTNLWGNLSSNIDPNGWDLGGGFTGSSGGVFVDAVFPLDAYIGQDVLFRFYCWTNDTNPSPGLYFDDIRPHQVFDSIVTLAAATSATTYAVTGAKFGPHDYQLQATDAQGQKSGLTLPHEVTVYYLSRGDMDANDVLDVIDVTRLIRYVFSGGPGAVVPGAEDCNCTSWVDVMDIIFLIDHVFRNGPAPSCA